MYTIKDVIINLNGHSTSSVLDVTCRVIRNHWPNGIIQNSLGEVYKSFDSIPFGKERELLIYKDEEAFFNWCQLGLDIPTFGTLIHVLINSKELTLVVDGGFEDVISEIKQLVSIGLPI